MKTKSAYTLFHSSALFTETLPPPRADIIKGTLKELQPFTVPKWDQRGHVTEVAPAWTLLLTTLETKKKSGSGFAAGEVIQRRVLMRCSLESEINSGWVVLAAG